MQRVPHGHRAKGLEQVVWEGVSLVENRKFRGLRCPSTHSGGPNKAHKASHGTHRHHHAQANCVVDKQRRCGGVRGWERPR